MPKSGSKVNEGFTLIELMVTLTIFSIISLMVMSIYISMSRAYVANLATRNAQQNIRSASDIITRYAKQARSANWDAASQTLSLNIDNDQAGTNVVHEVRFVCQKEDPADPDLNAARVIKMSVFDKTHGVPIIGTSERLTSGDLNITEFNVKPSPGIPAVLNVTLSGELLNVPQALEKGAGGDSKITIRTTILLKG